MEFVGKTNSVNVKSFLTFYFMFGAQVRASVCLLIACM